MFLSKINKKTLLLIIGIITFIGNTFGQGSNPDFARSMGKMYVVVAVIIAVFIGIVGFLIYMERKVRRLEQQIEHEK
ncbi:MAG: CcmD family protein [Cognaticolwellia sp.]|jgi:CcmD family protein